MLGIRGRGVVYFVYSLQFGGEVANVAREEGPKIGAAIQEVAVDTAMDTKDAILATYEERPRCWAAPFVM